MMSGSEEVREKEDGQDKRKSGVTALARKKWR
jgi:hypothetical protein